jgi:hypothetical protein
MSTPDLRAPWPYELSPETRARIECFYLHSPHHVVSWGPFSTPDRAWQMLFGRASTQCERTDEQATGWSVDQVKDHPARRQVAA